MTSELIKFGRTLSRLRAAERIARRGAATVAELIREGCVTSRQAAHHSLCRPWFGRRDGKVVLTAAGRRVLTALRQTVEN